MSGNLKKVFERIGILVLQKKWWPIFLMLLGLGPLGAAFFLYQETQSFLDLEETGSLAMGRVKSAFQRKLRKEAFLAKHENSDPYFLDKEIESLRFLEREKRQLKGWLSHPAISNKEKITRRMQFLEGNENRLSFAEGDIQTSKTCKETMEKQRNPIEIDAEDLNNLLAHIEETSEPNTSAKKVPQLLICNFSMTQKNTLLQNEVFEITMDLLKREFLAK